ncbi:MAG: nuclear transport factor 2 family protein, partial [Pseudomonadota bacterium]
MSESKNAGVARRIIRAVSEFDFDTVHALTCQDIVVEQPFPALGQPERYEGAEAFVSGLRLVPTVFSSFELTIGELFDCPEDEVVIFEQTSRGVFNLNGEIYENRYVMIFKFRDGKVAVWREYYNPETMT